MGKGDKKGLVLLVEDEAITARCIQIELQTRGFEVKSTATGEDAIEVIRDTKADFILMDIHLAGGLDGIETMRLIYDIKKIPFVYMTGYNDEHVVSRQDLPQPYKTLTKPVQIEEIYHIVDHCLEKVKNTV